MALKVFINIETGQIDKYEPVTHKEVIVNFDINDSLIIDEETGEIVKIQNSIQGKNRIQELQSKKELSIYEEGELEFLLPKNYMVNVTTENGEKHYVIHEITEGVDYDPNRGDVLFSSKEKAQEYIDLLLKQ